MSNNALTIIKSGDTLLTTLAQAIAEAPVDMAPSIKLALDKFTDVIEEMVKTNRLKLDMFMSVPGNTTQVTDKGTLESYIDGHRLRLIPQSSEPPSDEIIKALASKGYAKPEQYAKYFKAEVKYKTTELTLQLLVADGLLTAEDVTALRNNKKYRLEVKPPTTQD